ATLQRTTRLELVSPARRLEAALQRQKTFAPQLDLFSGEPDVVTFRYRLFFELDAELVLLDSPFAGSFATHGGTHHRSIALIEVAPVHVVRQFHAGELGTDLARRKFLEFLLRGSS